ncbi:MAG: DUF998 domain-containing protein [Candidatus Thermoplasmatota archaeon]|nr:DUF998 domain-containing protein [Candidatus Thermoplasmatota archaeon]
MTDISSRIGNLTKYFGGALVGVPWVLFLVCYLLNPQWVLTRDALSSFGDPSFSHFPWVYNIGLGIIAVIIWFMSFGIIATAENKVQVFGGTFWFVAGIFLGLIGYYHGGTYPHDFVSAWFFVQAAFAITLMGIGSYASKDIRGAIVPLVIAILMPLGDILIPFPSSATTEIYEIIIIDSWALFSLLYKPKKLPSKWEEHVGKLKVHRVRDAIIVGSLSTVFFSLAVLIIAFAFS